MRLIDADALIKDCKRTVQIADELKELNIKKTFSAMLNLVLTQPTVDAEPVRHGKWFHKGCGIFACSKCGKDVGLNVYTGEKASETFKWCPHCGARMDKE